MICLRRIAHVLALSSLPLGLACTDEATTPVQETETAVQKVERAFDEASEKARKLTAALGEELRRRVENLDEMIKDLEAKSQAASDQETQSILAESIIELKAKRTQLREKTDAVEKASGRAWKAFELGLEQAMIEFKQAYEDAIHNADAAEKEEL